ncbi:phage portal protein, partial [Clostridium perfringens]|uniref:phage portal protein n=1 Tax=Clostridium perfringens TaxID=1502 RepID=UPI002AC4C938
INIFGEVPVSIGELTEEGYYDSLYKDIKGLQEAFETNLSDIGNEISDFRNAYLLFKNAQVNKDDIPEMKRLGVIMLPGDRADAQWLIKNINDTFIQNTLDRYEDTMYQLACHINHNEKLQSNLSGVTLRSRLIVLENK